MSWLVFAFSGPVLWAFRSHLDKYPVERYFKNTDVAVRLVFTEGGVDLCQSQCGADSEQRAYCSTTIDHRILSDNQWIVRTQLPIIAVSA